MTISLTSLKRALRQSRKNKGVFGKLPHTHPIIQAAESVYKTVKANQQHVLNSQDEFEILKELVKSPLKKTPFSLIFTNFIEKILPIPKNKRFKPEILASIFQRLYQSDMLNRDNYELIKNYEIDWGDYADKAKVLSILDHAGILKQGNLDSDIFWMLPILELLDNAEILSQENLDLIKPYQDFYEVEWALKTLINTGIATEDNFKITFSSGSYKQLASLLCQLHRYGLLTPDNQALVRNNNEPALLSIISSLAWNKILSQEMFVAIKEHPNPESVISILYQLDQAGILNTENRKLILQSDCLESIKGSINAFFDYELLTQGTFDIIVNCLDLNKFRRTLFQLAYNKILTKETYNSIQSVSDHERAASILIELQKAGMLNSENSETIKNHKNLQEFWNALYALNKKRILNQEILDMLKPHPQPLSFAFGLESLQEDNLLTLENSLLIAENTHCRDAAKGLCMLHQAQLLTPRSREEIKKHTYPQRFARSLCELHQEGILDEPLREFINTTPYSEPLILLHKANILTQENLLAFKHKPELHICIITLHKGGLLNQEYFDLIKMHSSPWELAYAMSELGKAGIASAENFQALTSNNKPQEISMALCRLHEKRILTEQNRAAVKVHSSPLELASVFIEIHQDRFDIDEEYLDDIRASEEPWALASAFNVLHKAGLLNEDYRGILLSSNKPALIARAFAHLHQAKMLNEANRNLIISTDIPEKLARAFVILHQAEILNETNRKAILSSGIPEKLARAFFILNQAEILNETNRNTMISNAIPRKLASAFFILHQAEILNETNRNTIISSGIPEELASALVILHQAEILNETRRHIIIGSDKPEELAKALSLLGRARILQEEDYQADIIGSRDPFGLAWAFGFFHSLRLLNENTRNKLIGLQDRLTSFNNIFKKMGDARILTQETFDQLLLPRHQWLITGEASRAVWYYLPTRFLTLEVFQELLTLAARPNPQEVIPRYTEELINREIVNQAETPRINYAQSIHNESVHKSVSESARKLLNRYEVVIKARLDNIIKEIKALIDDLSSDSLINRAAKNGIERISAQPICNYIDSNSNVTTKQLLALVYLAVHDNALRIGSLEDARMQFVQGLYEMQRGYNLSDSDVDLGDERDQPICTAGTFNKLIEKLQGIHPDCEIRFVTKSTAALKLPSVVREVAIKYLQTLANPKTAMGFIAFTELVHKIEREGAEVIWEKIKEQVEKHMLDEFSTFYPNNEIRSLAMQGRYTNLNDLNSLQESIALSKGYRQYCYQTLRRNGFFSLAGTSNNSFECDKKNTQPSPR